MPTSGFHGDAVAALNMEDAHSTRKPTVSFSLTGSDSFDARDCRLPHTACTHSSHFIEKRPWLVPPVIWGAGGRAEGPAAPSSAKNATQTRDPEMKQTREGKNWHFGMQPHIGTNRKGRMKPTLERHCAATPPVTTR